MDKKNKTLQELNLLDRFLFAEAAEDEEFLKTVLEIIFEKDILLKHLPQAEREIRGGYENKKIRLDVWTEDEDDNVYDIEAQKENTGSLPKRSRYYQGLIDSKLLPEGSVSYNLLADTYIILISPFDMFGKGRYRYTFKMFCEENKEIELRDGATRIFLNTGGSDGEGISEELISLLRYFENTREEVAEESGSERIKLLHSKVTAIKENNSVGVKYMNLYEEMIMERQAGIEEGIARGVEQGIAQVAVKLLNEGIETAIITKTTGLSMKEIEEIEKELEM